MSARQIGGMNHILSSLVLAAALGIIAEQALAEELPPLPVCDMRQSQTHDWVELGETVELETVLSPDDHGGAVMGTRATLALVRADGTRMVIGVNDKIIDDWGPEGVSCEMLMETVNAPVVRSLEGSPLDTVRRDIAQRPEERIYTARTFDVIGEMWDGLRMCKDKNGAWRSKQCERGYKRLDPAEGGYEHFRLFEQDPALARRLMEARAPLISFSASAYIHETLAFDEDAGVFHRFTIGGC